MEKTEMIFGTRAVMEAIKAGREIEKIFVQSGLSNDLIKELIKTAAEHKAPYTFVPQQKLNNLSNKNHQGVICVLSAVQYAPLENIIDKCYQEGREPFFLIVDRVTDVRNFGAIARTAECSGVDAIIIPSRGSAQINADAIKTSTGALQKIPVCREENLKTVIDFLKDCGVQIIACTEKTTDYYFQIDFTVPTAIIMGSEEDGILNEYLQKSDGKAKIPLMGEIGSLNVSVACGIILYEAVSQRLVN